ncbi:MAG: hypothetical protein ACKPKO_31780, partial [Candidatus Fonsibacter sp.]
SGLGTLPELNQYSCHDVYCADLPPVCQRYVFTGFVKDDATIVGGISGKILPGGYGTHEFSG